MTHPNPTPAEPVATAEEVERVADALEEQHGPLYGFSGIRHDAVKASELARAAIAALRTPTATAQGEGNVARVMRTARNLLMQRAAGGWFVNVPETVEAADELAAAIVATQPETVAGGQVDGVEVVGLDQLEGEGVGGPHEARLMSQRTPPASSEAALWAEIERLEGCLGYLASCQAATAEATTKRTGKGERARQGRLCEIALAMLNGDYAPRDAIGVSHRLERAREHIAALVQSGEASHG